MKIFVCVFLSKARTWDKGYHCCPKVRSDWEYMLKSCGIDTLLPDTISRGYERIGHFFFCILNGKKTPQACTLFFLQTPNLHKSGEVRAMTLIIFILFKLSTVGWDNETLMLYCTCMPKFHCRSRQWIFQFSLRSHSETVRNMLSLPDEH